MIANTIETRTAIDMEVTNGWYADDVGALVAFTAVGALVVLLAVVGTTGASETGASVVASLDGAAGAEVVLTTGATLAGAAVVVSVDGAAGEAVVVVVGIIMLGGKLSAGGNVILMAEGATGE